MIRPMKAIASIVALFLAGALNEARAQTTAPSGAQSSGSATVEPAATSTSSESVSDTVAQSIVKVQFGTGPDEWVWGAVVADEGGHHPDVPLVVVPETYGVSEDLALDPDLVDTRILKRAKERWNAATIVGTFTPEPVQFADCLPMLGAALLQVKGGHGERPAFEISKDPLDPTQPVIVNHGPERHAGRLKQIHSAEVFPWQVLLDDESEPQPGAPVTNDSGQLLGIVKRISSLESKAAGHDPAADKSDLHVFVPATHLLALLVLPPSGIKENDALRALTAGMLLGAEQGRAQQLQLAGNLFAGRPGTAALLAELNAPPELIVDRSRGGLSSPGLPKDSQVKYISLSRLDSEAALKFLPYMFGDWVSFTTGPNRRGIVVRTTAEIQPVVELLLQVLDGDPKDAAQLSFTVSPPAELPNGKAFEIRLFPLEHLTVDQAGETVSKLYPWGSGVVLAKVPSHGALMARGTTELMEQIAVLIKELDVPAAKAADADDAQATRTLEASGSLNATAAESPEVLGPAAGGAFGGGFSKATPYGGGGIGGGRAGDEDDEGGMHVDDEAGPGIRFGGGRAPAGGRGMMGMIGGGRMGDEDSAPQTVPLEVKVFTLQHLSGDDAMSVLNSLFAGSTTFSRVASQKTVIIANGPTTMLNEIEALLKTLDAAPPIGVEPIEPVTLSQVQLASALVGDGQPTSYEMKLFRLAHMHPVNAVNALSPLFLGSGPIPGGGRMAGGGRAVHMLPEPKLIAVQSQRALIARGLADDLKKIEALLKVLDVPEVEPPESAEAAAKATAEEDEKLPPNSFLMRYQLWDANWRDVDVELLMLRSQSGSEWFRIDTDAKNNTVTVIGSSAGLQKPSGLIQKLDPNAQLVLTDNYPPKSNASGFAVDESPGDVEALRRAYAEHEAKVRDQADRGRDPAAHLDGRPPQKIADELRAAVVTAFDARQNLQRAELAALEQKLVSMRRTISAREKIKQQIVDRRIEELLNPALDWDTSANGKRSPAKAANGFMFSSDWPVAFRHEKQSVDVPSGAEAVQRSPITSPEVSTERLYRGKTESEWRQNFKLETEPVAKVDAAVALLNLAAQNSPEQVVEQILDIGEGMVDSKYRDDPLAFALETLAPQRWNVGGAEHNKAYMEFHFAIERIMSSLPPKVLAESLASAITAASEERAAFASYLLTYVAQTRIAADKAASQIALERLDGVQAEPGSPAAMLAMLGKLSVARAATDVELEKLASEIVETCEILQRRRSDSDPVEDAFVDRLTSALLPSALLNNPSVTQRLAELILVDVVDRGRRTARLVQPLPVMVYPPQNGVPMSDLESVRVALGPALRGWVEVANGYLDERGAPFSEPDRAVSKGLSRATSVFSDGDDWPVERTAEILTTQLRAAYTDDPTATVDQPLDELLPAKPSRIVSQIVAITGEIPEFVGTATPNSKAVADKLSTLDRLLAGKVAKSRIDEELATLDGLLGDAPVETVRRLVSNADDSGEIHFGEHAQLVMRLIDITSSLNANAEPLQSQAGSGGGFFPATPTPSRETIDPLLLLGILNGLAGTDEKTDAQIARLFQLEVTNGEVGDQIKILLASPLQSRKHASRMLQEMAGKSKSRSLIDRIRLVDPKAVAASAATNEPAAPAAEPENNAAF